MFSLPPEVQDYLAQYRYKIELHAHTSPGSGCSELPPREFLSRLRAQGYHAVVITNHFSPGSAFTRTEDPVGTYLADYYEAKQLEQEYDITVLLGAEFRFEENCNDYLIFGVDEAFLREAYPQLNMSFRDFYERWHAPERIICQAHPFRHGITPIDGAHLDGIEAFNMHPGHNSRVTVASRYAAVEHIPIITVGTDLHHPGHEGSAALRARFLPKNNDELIALLRSGDYLFEIGGHPLLPYYSFD